jgi:glycosyltransferase involved in cell wall biosynthesis
LATHHDFYWEREHLKQPVGKLIDDFLKKYVPPVLPALNHAVINSISAKKLLNKTGITAAIIPDTFDFTMSPWVKDDYNKYLISDFNLNENDIFILQATRIVKRKGIELIPPIIQRLNSPEYLNQLNGQKLYNGKIVTEQSRFVLLLAGYAEDEATIYLNLLKNQMIKLKIPHCFMKDRIAAERKIHNSVKFYSLFDTYPYSDLISFPSQFEGWGNQFLEAVFAKKPVMIFEYPVFKKDIKPFGYHFISMGDKILSYDDDLIHLSDEKIELVCNEIIRTLKSNRTNEKLEYNYKLAEKNNSQTYLSRLMKWSMDHYED